MTSKILAIAAWIAGVLVGRPFSGRLLAHYLWGSGTPMRLSKKLERQLLALWQQCQAGFDLRITTLAHEKEIVWRACKELEDLTSRGFDSHRPLTVLATHGAGDLFTSVGTLMVWVEAGELHYLDHYNWIEGECWSFRVRYLPFSIYIRGQDSTMRRFGGREFVTSGHISLEQEEGRG